MCEIISATADIVVQYSDAMLLYYKLVDSCSVDVIFLHFIFH